MLNWKVALKIIVDAAITAVVPNGLQYRSPQVLAVLPCVTYFIVVDITAPETGPQNVLFQIDIWHESDIVAEQIRDLISDALHDKPFTIVGASHEYLREINKMEEPFDQDVDAFHFIMEFRSMYYRD